jgi:hypothetical protein
MMVTMTPLDIKRLKSEKLRVQAARSELELRIDERLEEIERIKENIAIQQKRESEIDEILANSLKA